MYLITLLTRIVCLIFYNHTLPLQAPRDLLLAADDEVTRQRCLRIMQAACADSISTTLQSIASAAALTRNLFCMKSAAAVTAVLSALSVGMNEVSFNAINFNLALLKEFQFEARDLRAAGFNLADMQAAGFNARELKAAGFDVVYDFNPEELCAMLRNNNGEQIVACNSVKEMCLNMRKGSASAKTCIEEALSKYGLLLLMFTCAGQACRAVDPKMEVGEDGLTEPATQIIEAQTICDAVSAVACLDIFDENTTLPLPDATKLCRLAGAVCSLWRNCHYINQPNRKPLFVNEIMNMALSITQAMIFFETHHFNSMAWEHRSEIYQIELSDRQFLRSLLMVVAAKPRTRWAFLASCIIRNGTNVLEFCNR